MAAQPQENQKLVTIAARLAELGHPVRLSIFKLLVKSGGDGVSVGDIQQALDIPGSTLSHHIAKMLKVNLIRQVRESRTLYCYPEFDSLNDVVDYLADECCINQRS